MLTVFLKVARPLLVALALVGIVGVVPIVQRQFTGAAACPALGPVPACYLVLLGYILIAVSAIFSAQSRHRFFLLGWLPLFLLALTGSGLEVVSQNACPRSAAGMPTCYLSLGLLVLLAMIYRLEIRYDANHG